MTEQTSKSELAQQHRGRVIFIMMAIFFTVPIFVVIAMFKLDWKPSGESYGELMSPPRLVEGSVSLMNDKNQSQDKFWNEKWNMVFVANECATVCMTKLQDMRQIHVSTYKHVMRVQRVLITQQQDVTTILGRFPDLLIINQPTNGIGVLMNQFNVGDENAVSANRTYLIDPLGYIMMSFPHDAKPAKIRKDLVRLLKTSWAG